ncbi:MAG: hypothetical protein HQL11_00300 [Candidatus Omnitrophica bacterium]|nr:hypothetical protein [Candidatus Omnitrophota bacterium]
MKRVWVLAVLAMLAFPMAGKAAEDATIVIKVLAINPSAETEMEVPIKTYLPAEVRPEHVLNTEEFELEFDESRGAFFVQKKVKLQPKESQVLRVVIRDVWRIPDEELNKLEKRTAAALAALEDPAFRKAATPLEGNIRQDLALIRIKSSAAGRSPKERIDDFRDSSAVLESLRTKVKNLEDFVSESNLSYTQTPRSANPAWTPLLILGVIAFLGILSVVCFWTAGRLK